MQNKNKKIVIVAANNIRYSPYIFFYTDILKKNNIKYDLIYPNRNNLYDEIDCNVYECKWNHSIPIVLNYMLYANKVKKIINKENYASIIVLTSTNAVFLGKWLRKKYYKKYIIDIRDYTHEYNKLYYLIEKKAVVNSGLNIISSKAFTKFLPKAQYFVCHNISVDKNIIVEKWIKPKAQEKLIIGYVGAVAYINECKKLIKLIEKDDRFQFHIYGDGEGLAELKRNCEFNNYKNTKFFGGFKPEEKSNIIKNIDILFNTYGNNSEKVLCALSNKLYDCMYYKKLIINSPNTFMNEISGICGFTLDYSEEKCLDKLYKWCNNLNSKEITKFQILKMENFKNENSIVEKNILDFFRRILNEK